MRVVTYIAAALIFSVPSAATKQPRCPSDMVEVRGVCVDLYEWPNKKGVKPLLGATGIETDYDRERGVTMDATTLCASVGKRTCTRTEWIRACRGSRPASCNTGRRHIAPDENKVYERDPREMERLDQSTPSGSMEECVSSSGVFDTVGNVEEWTRCDSGKFGWCLVGRYWSERQSCTYNITVHSPNWHYYETGFRCCKDVNDD